MTRDNVYLILTTFVVDSSFDLVLSMVCRIPLHEVDALSSAQRVCQEKGVEFFVNHV
jgi:hypothetical protein